MKTLGKAFIPQSVKQFQDELKQAGINTIIAGGSIRDQVHGREVKDYDLWVVGDISYINDKVVNYVYQTMSVYYKCNGVYGNYMHEEEKVESVKDLKDDRYQGVVKFETPDGYDIDIVLAFDYTDKPPKGLGELLDTFDMSLNQYGVDENGMIATKFDGVDVLPVRKDFNQNRLNYIKGKYPQYCYKECDKLFATPLLTPALFLKDIL